MTTPSKRSKKSARAAGASRSEAQPATDPTEAIDTAEMQPATDATGAINGKEAATEHGQDQEVKPAEPPIEIEEGEPTVLMDGSREQKDRGGTEEGTEEGQEEGIEERMQGAAAPVTQPLRALPKVTQPLPALPGDLALAAEEGEAEGEATMIARTPSRPRKTTLAMAITPRPMPALSDAHDPYDPRDLPGAQSAQGAQATRDSVAPAESPANARDGGAGARRGGESAGVVADEIDEWSIADQPTVYLSPQVLTTPPWSPGSNVETPAPAPDEEAPRRPEEHELPPRERSANSPRWLASTDDDRWPATTHRPPAPAERARTFPPSDEHMERFQRLREGRMAHQEGNRGPSEGRQVADIVRQWWRDLRPGLTSALSYQREARASGVHPIPAHEPLPGSRLGDAFGRFAASAREMTGRAQSAMTPRLNRLQELHAQAESKASALVQKMEAPLSRQQAPLLGPGRIAVFFKPGVTVGQAQSLLGASRARPIRLIPRKHGFLALVPPGAEAEICERLREHPYIRDVAYVEYDEYGDPIRPPVAPR